MTHGRRWIAVATVADCPVGEIRGLNVEGQEIALYHLEDGEFCATDNLCTHGQAYLSEGWIVDGCRVECPLHSGCFDIRTGRGEGPPIDQDLKTYPLREEEGQLFIELLDERAATLAAHDLNAGLKALNTDDQGCSCHSHLKD